MVLMNLNFLFAFVSYLNDIISGSIVMAVCLSINFLDVSNLYHSIRSQSTLKLYVIFNVLEVLDKLFSSFGLDLLDTFFAQPIPNSHFLTPFCLFVVSIIYTRRLTLNFHFRLFNPF